MKRRTLLKTGLTAIAAVPLRRVAAGYAPGGAPAPAAFTETQLATLKAIAAIVLPSEIGRAGRDEVADRFTAWIKSYKPGADMDHGYGFTRIRATEPSPLAAYAAQMRALDARAGRGITFAALPAARQRAIVRQSLEGVERLPVRPDGKNLVADLMGFYFHSSEANDLCYRAEVGRDTCRGLPGSNRPPRRKA
jgi:hypothetical protein